MYALKCGVVSGSHSAGDHDSHGLAVVLQLCFVLHHIGGTPS